MCTVSFISHANKVYLTSNRDEHFSRPPAYAPQEEMTNGIKIIYPKDPKAGGSWFACNETGTVIVLLNGAFEKHESLGNYTKSRGLVVLDIIGQHFPVPYLQHINLNGIEPFTIVLYSDLELHEMRWDGSKKHIKQLNTNHNHIWSSSTLYTPHAAQNKAELFKRFTKNTVDLKSKDIIDFHSYKGNDLENGFVIERTTGLKTFSVTQVIASEESVTMCHLDLLNDQQQSKGLALQTPMNIKA